MSTKKKRQRKTVQIRINVVVHAWLKMVAQEQEITLSQLLDEIVLSTLPKKVRKRIKRKM